MNAAKAIALATKNVGGHMDSSARLCLDDAIRLFESGDKRAAHSRAVKSLRFSVGMFHADYVAANS